MRQDGGTVAKEGSVRAGVLSGENAMTTSVGLSPKCRFDIGIRTPMSRALVRLCVKTILAELGRYAGKPPAARPDPTDPARWAWAEARWEVEYSLTEHGGRRKVVVELVRLR